MKPIIFWICLGLLLISGSGAQASMLIAGTPISTTGAGTFDSYIAEGSDPRATESIGPFSLPMHPGLSFVTGYIVLLDRATADPTDSTNWSDVFYVQNAGLGQVFGLISDGGTGHPDTGIDDSQLSSIGATVAGIISAPNTVYIVEAPFSTTVPVVGAVSGNGAIIGPLIDPSGSGTQARYVINSDPLPEPSGLALFSTGAIGLCAIVFRHLRRNPRLTAAVAAAAQTGHD
jgi:hypothetical protein